VLANTVAGLDQVHFVVLTAGRYDCLAEVVCVDTDDMLSLINDSIRCIPGVKDVEVISYLKLVKQWQPEYIQPPRVPRSEGWKAVEIPPQ
jgi:Lrp/AsnC family transcriptional regulator for asnA, asnC and gidA